MRTKLAGSTGKLARVAMALTGVLFAPISLLAQEPALDISAPPASESPGATLCLLLIGMVLGVGGQIARSAVGLKKEMDQAGQDQKSWDSWFNMQELLVSLLLGGAAGAFAAILLRGTPLNRQFLLACIAAGYAGSDFIQGFMQKYVTPSADNSANTDPNNKKTVTGGGGTSGGGGTPKS